MGRITVLPPITRTVGMSPSAGSGPSQVSIRAGVSGESHSKVTWLRARKRRRSLQAGSSRAPTTIARAGGGSAASPWSPRSPLIRCDASRPTSFATSGEPAATAW